MDPRLVGICLTSQRSGPTARLARPFGPVTAGVRRLLESRLTRLKIYCEHGALTPRIRKLGRSGRTELVHFPYDPDSRSQHISSIARPSNAQIRDLNLPIKDLPIADYSGSYHFDEILSILGREHRRDALHVDSAFKSGCSAFITEDSDILKHKARLEGLLGIRFFHPDAELSDLEQFIAGDSGAA